MRKWKKLATLLAVVASVILAVPQNRIFVSAEEKKPLMVHICDCGYTMEVYTYGMSDEEYDVWYEHMMWHRSRGETPNETSMSYETYVKLNGNEDSSSNNRQNTNGNSSSNNNQNDNGNSSNNNNHSNNGNSNSNSNQNNAGNSNSDNSQNSNGNSSNNNNQNSNGSSSSNNNQNSNGNSNSNNNQNNNESSNSSTSGILQGTGDTTDFAVYGEKQLTVQPVNYKTISLSWDAVSDAKNYEIFYSTSPNSGFKRLAKVKGTSYKFTRANCGTTYYFQMRVCKKGETSKFGPISYGKTDLTGTTQLQVKKTTYNSVTLKWSKVAGAKKYEILYADSMGSGWQSLGIKGGTSFTHKKLVTGATYFYQIRPVRDAFYGDWSNGVSAKTELGDVSRLKVNAQGADRMKLSWKKVQGAGQYVILRSGQIDGTYEVIGHAAKTSYVDTGLAGGTTYFYKVYAVSGPYRTKETAPVGQTTKIVKK